MKRAFKRAAKAAFRSLALLESRFDSAFLLKSVPAPNLTAHRRYEKYLSHLGNHAGVRVLEIGSREVTVHSTARARFSSADYVGFDFYPGNNVDVVGDVHRLSSYFKPGEQFDLIYSVA